MEQPAQRSEFEVEFGVDDGEGGGAGHAKASACFFIRVEIFGESSGVWEEEAGDDGFEDATGQRYVTYKTRFERPYQLEYDIWMESTSRNGMSAS